MQVLLELHVPQEQAGVNYAGLTLQVSLLLIASLEDLFKIFQGIFLYLFVE